MKHIQQLDSLRTIAVALVIVNHWVPYGNVKFVFGLLNGVDIFFVLSGFLITNILLKNRQDAESSAITMGSVFKNFYLRRALRIFPVYYMLLIVIFVLNWLKYTITNTPDTTNYIYYLTYTANFHIYNLKHWGQITHLWSLSVEEQFYIFWPLMMLLIKRKYLPYTIIVFICIGVITQFLVPYSEFKTVLTYTCFDAFGLGALLSWIVVFRKDFLNNMYPTVCILALIGCLLIMIVYLRHDWITVIPLRTARAFIALWLITHIITERQKPGLLLKLLNNRYLIGLGKVSYGIYLFHHPLPYFTNRFLTGLNMKLPDFVNQYNNLLLFLENLCLLLIISWSSWKLFEKPILGLKKKFEYSPKKSVQTVMERQYSSTTTIISQKG